MKTVIIVLGFLCLSSFVSNDKLENDNNIEVVIGSSFSLINDTKEKVSIHTGSGFVSLNKGSKTSISCKSGKEVRWASKGKKGDVIFEIKSSMCGKTIKLSDML